MALGLKSNDIIKKHSAAIKSNQVEKNKGSDFYLDSNLKQFINSVDNYIKNNLSEECALIAYPSHFDTEHIVEIIKNYIDVSHHDKIISLIPINKNRSASAYLISPFILDEIREKIYMFKKQNVGKKATVLLFDEAIIDGNTRKELKHLLFYLGADEVNTLCILDRRRLPFNTTDPQKHKAYWRLDIPRLGNRDNCLLCKSLDLIDSFKNNLIYSYDKIRIERWKSAWNCRFPYSISNLHGLISKTISPINKKFSIYLDSKTGEIKFHDTIQLTNSVGLSIYTGEIHAMTARDDMAINICQSLNIDSLVKIEVLAFNLLLFGKDSSFGVNCKMVNMILQEMNALNFICNETAFGILAIISQPNEIINSALKDINYASEINNQDLELFYCYYFNSNESELEKMPSIKRHFRSQYIKNIKSVYYNFHHELHNDFGRPHNTALDNLSTLSNVSKFTIGLDFCKQAVASCEKLENIITLFPLWNTRTLYSKDNMVIIIDRIKELTRMLNSHILNIQNETCKDILFYKEDSRLFSEFQNIQDKAKLLKKSLSELHLLLFINIGSNREDNSYFPLRDAIKIILESYEYEDLNSKVILCDFDKKRDETQYDRWIPWDKQIEKKIYNIINNIKHAKGYINKERNYFENNSENQDLAKMLLSIKYSTKNLQLIFENYSDKSAKNISTIAEAKNKPEKQHIVDLEGRVFYDDNHNLNDTDLYLVKTIIELPYQ